jgi:NAD(P)-dependent dehydrogenase (short-subunit alcohol dehydrogenase family)
VIGVPADVTDAASMRDLADTAFDAHGGVDVLCANAGVSGPPFGAVWEIDDDHWQRVLSVNVLGVVHSAAAFVPRMIDAGREGRIVVTVSIAAVSTSSMATPYYASKRGALAVVEALRRQVEASGAPITVSALCPGPVRTGIVEREQRFAPAPAPPPVSTPVGEHDIAARAVMGGAEVERLEPDEVASVVLDGIRSPRPYLFTHGNTRERILDWIEPVLAASDDVSRG